MATQVPTRLLVLQRLLKVLSEVEVIYPDGTTANFADKVCHGRNLLGEESSDDQDRDFISVTEGPRPDYGTYAGDWDEARRDELVLLIQAVCDRDAANANPYWLHAAIEQKLSIITATRNDGTDRPVSAEHYMLGKIISGFTISAPVIRPPDTRASTARAFVFLPVRVGIGGLVSNPYTPVP